MTRGSSDNVAVLPGPSQSDCRSDAVGLGMGWLLLLHHILTNQIGGREPWAAEQDSPSLWSPPGCA